MKSNVWGAALTVNLKISMNEYYLTALVTQTFNFISRVFFLGAPTYLQQRKLRALLKPPRNLQSEQKIEQNLI